MDAAVLSLMCQCSPDLLWDYLVFVECGGDLSTRVPQTVVEMVRDVQAITSDVGQQIELLMEKVDCGAA